jgi:hypothetical protein
VRKTATLEAAVPWLYLKGISSGEMAGALEVLVGPEAKGLSASTVSRLKQVWGEEYGAWTHSRLDQDRWAYLWADGVYRGLRAEDAKLCALVIIGVNERGEKRFLAIEDGVRESTQSWLEVLLGLKSRGMSSARLAIADIETEIKQPGPEDKQQQRAQKAQPLLDQFKDWLDKSSLQVPPKSAAGKAIVYSLRQWPKLILYVEDGNLAIDNNRAERAIKPFVIGRKNWMFSNMPRGAQASAILYSLIETAKANGLTPFDYLWMSLERLPGIEALLPWVRSA